MTNSSLSTETAIMTYSAFAAGRGIRRWDRGQGQNVQRRGKGRIAAGTVALLTNWGKGTGLAASKTSRGLCGGSVSSPGAACILVSEQGDSLRGQGRVKKHHWGGVGGVGSGTSLCKGARGWLACARDGEYGAGPGTCWCRLHVLPVRRSLNRRSVEGGRILSFL